MLKSEIEEAIRERTPLAWAFEIPRSGPWPKGGLWMLPLEVRANGRVLVQGADDRERVVRSRNLMAPWEEYREVRERIEEQIRVAQADREAHDERRPCCAGSSTRTVAGAVRARMRSRQRC